MLQVTLVLVTILGNSATRHSYFKEQQISYKTPKTSSDNKIWLKTNKFGLEDSHGPRLVDQTAENKFKEENEKVNNGDYPSVAPGIISDMAGMFADELTQVGTLLFCTLWSNLPRHFHRF